MCLVRGTKLELRTNIVDISRDENISFRCRIDSSHQIEETEAFHFSVKQQDTSKTKVSYKSELPQPRMAQWGWGGVGWGWRGGWQYRHDEGGEEGGGKSGAGHYLYTRQKVQLRKEASK